MRVTQGVACLAFAVISACATTDVKGRETYRIGALRHRSVSAASVKAGPVAIDAGTNVLTDAELTSLANELPARLADEFAAYAAQHRVARAGEAEIVGCRVDAGPGRANTVFEAKCRVRVRVRGVIVVEVNAQALRRIPTKAVSEDELAAHKRGARSAYLPFDDTRAVLIAALGAAAALVHEQPLPVKEAARAPPVTLSRAEKRALAIDRLARARTKDDASAARVGLLDLGDAGFPEDTALVVAWLAANPEHAARADAVRAMGDLCGESARAPLVALRANDADESVRALVDAALAKIDACAALPR